MQPARLLRAAGAHGRAASWRTTRRRRPRASASTTTTEGETVPFIVRIETGYQDRDQYKIATLFDPAQPWEPWAPQDGWNRRLVFTHGGSCGTDRAAGSAPDVMREELLGKGFMVASTALNNLGHNCNPVVIAESELMARERVSEQYGPPRATLGTGCSGGAIAQMMLAHAYPGFYDGITVQCTFADLFTTGKQAISGHLFRKLFGPGGRPTGRARMAAGLERHADRALLGGRRRLRRGVLAGDQRHGRLRRPVRRRRRPGSAAACWTTTSTSSAWAARASPASRSTTWESSTDSSRCWRAR